jgi:hypothetical protein
MSSVIANKNRAMACIARVKRLVLRKGGENGIRSLSRTLGIANDEGGASTVDQKQLAAALAEHGVVFDTDDFRALWSYFDRSGLGSVDPAELIAALRGGVPPFRRTLIERAWESLPKEKDGSVALTNLHRAFVPSGHPDVVKGLTSAVAIKQAFETSFSLQTNPDGFITRQEFEQFYVAVSASYVVDEAFAALIRGCWKIHGADDYFTKTLSFQDKKFNESFSASQSLGDKQSISENMLRRQRFDSLVELHRKVLFASKGGVRGVGRLFRLHDTARTKYLSAEVFLEALWQNRLYVEDKSLLTFLDTNNDNTVDYACYLNVLIGDFPPARRLLLERLWKSFPTDKTNRAELSSVLKGFIAADVTSLNNFLDAWDKKFVPSGKVEAKELEEWYAPLSANTSLDSQFEQILRAEWAC